MNASQRFRAALRREREARGLTRADMGRLVGKKRQFIAYLEDHANGANLSTIDEFAAAFGVDPIVLLLPSQDDP